METLSALSCFAFGKSFRPSLPRHVPHVVLVIGSDQMVRVYTPWVVAPMTNDESVWDWTDVVLI